MTQKLPLRARDELKSWTKPELRSIVPASRTRGGNGPQNDQDDSFYDLS